MEPYLSALLSFYTFSTGRRLFALMQMKKRAADAGHADLVAHADATIAHDTDTRALEATWAGRKQSTFSPEARQIDIYVDTAITSLRDAIDAQIRASAPGDPLAEKAKEMQQVLYPKGAGAITSLGYVDELAEVVRILDRVAKDDYKSLVVELGLSRQVTRLVELEKQYRSVIEGTGAPLTYDKVKAARGKGQALMLQAVAMILGKHPSDSDADRKARGALLEPILIQNMAIRNYLRDRKPIEDVDPITGDVETTKPSPPAEPTNQ